MANAHWAIKRSGRTLFSEVVVCDDFWRKGMGLMGRRKPLGKRECLLFIEGREKSPVEMAIHMQFCFFPIDVAWLDKDGKIIDIQKAVPAELLRPATWKIYAPAGGSMYIIEARADCGLKKGMKLELHSA